MRRLLHGWKGIAAALAACGLLAGTALAAGNELRLPVEKTARITPVGEVADPDAKAAKSVPGPADKGEKGEKGPALKAPKTTLAKAAEAAAANAPAEAAAPAPAKASAKAETKPAPKAAAKAESKPKAHKAEAKSEAKPAAKPETKPVVKAPAVKPDPLAGKLPSAAAAQPAAPLPAEGRWVGGLTLEYHADRVVLRAAANGQVERVTWFNVADKNGPRKLALDLRGAWRKKGGDVLRCETGPVKVVVVGEHPDRLRLAVEFRDGAVKPDLEPKVEQSPQGVSVTIPLALRLAP